MNRSDRELPKEKKQGLNCIMHHYGSGMHQFSDDDIRNVWVIRIDIDSMTEKSMTEGYRFLGSIVVAFFYKPDDFIPDLLCVLNGFRIV
jgi:hypothetical protein